MAGRRLQPAERRLIRAIAAPPLGQQPGIQRLARFLASGLVRAYDLESSVRMYCIE